MSPGAGQARLQVAADLPIAAAVTAIGEALGESQVVIVAGATGSGKTTQLPKICLAAGRGTSGKIAHTQPRRIAALSVAARIADELGVDLGGFVGCRVRYDDRSSHASRIVLMTDGILLNAIRRDQDLRAFDTIIIDEAHERSVNIDFLLGYLKRLLPRRPDLKLIITSATVDAQAFGAYYGGAPVVEVEGRAYPVTIEHAPAASGEAQADTIVRVCRDLAARPAASHATDILVFLPGAQSIREAHAALRRDGPSGFEILPLYARLKAKDQKRVFAPGAAPRIVLATNVAETSLTVPRIGFVVDSGVSRVKRYSVRHRIDTLRIEKIARASAAQRAGRCGRIAPGTCVRLYSEADFKSRPAYTDSEILRTNLAGVLLSLRTLGFARIDDFPFMDPPAKKHVNDAERLLHVLGACDVHGRLSRDGRQMARLPVDPRLARVLLEAHRQKCLAECLVLAAALGAGDPREAMENSGPAQSSARDTHTDRRSDFSTLLAIWQAYLEKRRAGAGAIRKFCRDMGLAENRVREWDDLHGQLTAVTRSLGWRAGALDASYARVHKSLLAGFVDYTGRHEGNGEYRGMHDVRSRIFPGSVAARRPPKWVVAAEHVAMERSYLRIAGRIEPRWIEEVAPQLLRRHIGEPRWDARRGYVAAPETVSIFGLVLAADRWVDFGRIDAAAAREIFIRDGLAANAVKADAPFLKANREAKQRIQALEARRRSRDLYIGDRGLAAFYARQLPESVRDRRSLLAWCADPAHDRALTIDWRELMTEDVAAGIDDDCPATIECAGQMLTLSYRYDPGGPCDGITLSMPVVLLDAISAERLEWLVPGHLPEKVLALLRTLRKEIRRPLVPLPQTLAAILPALRAHFGAGGLVSAVAGALTELTGTAVPESAFAPEKLPPYLTMRVELIAPDGTVIAADRDFESLRHVHGGLDSPLASLGQAGRVDSRSVYTAWDFDDLPDSESIERFGTELTLRPVVAPSGRGVRRELVPPGPSAETTHRLGVRRLLALALPQQAALIRSRVRSDRELLLAYHGIGTSEALIDDVVAAAVEAAFEFDADCRRKSQFRSVLAQGRDRFVECGEQVLVTLRIVLGEARELRLLLDGLAEGTGAAAADMRSQLGRLVFPGFLAATPPDRLPQLPRYLSAMRRRCESLRYRNTRDAKDQALVEKADARWLAVAASLPAGWPLPDPVLKYRWLTEELRVSLFAQHLRTAAPVSGKRLERFWNENVRSQ